MQRRMVRNKQRSKTGIQGDNRYCCRKFIRRSASDRGVGGVNGGITGGTDDGIKNGIDRPADCISNSPGWMSIEWFPSANNNAHEDLSKMLSGI
jgi:hypothetical protein